MTLHGSILLCYERELVAVSKVYMYSSKEEFNIAWKREQHVPETQPRRAPWCG